MVEKYKTEKICILVFSLQFQPKINLKLGSRRDLNNKLLEFSVNINYPGYISQLSQLIKSLDIIYCFI